MFSRTLLERLIGFGLGTQADIQSILNHHFDEIATEFGVALEGHDLTDRVFGCRVGMLLHHAVDGPHGRGEDNFEGRRCDSDAVPVDSDEVLGISTFAIKVDVSLYSFHS